MNFLSSMQSVFAQDPMLLTVQAGLLLGGSFVVFLLLFATRDIILRTHSFLYQIGCIVLVAILPVIGFLMYLLIRPARTIKEREMEAMLKGIADVFALSGEQEEGTEERETIEGIEAIEEIEEENDDKKNEDEKGNDGGE